MHTIRGGFSARPRLRLALASVAFAALALGLPIPRRTVVGHDLHLTLSGAGLGADQARRVAREITRALGAESAPLAVADGGFVIDARLPARDGEATQQEVDATLRSLRRRGLTAQATVTPHVERRFQNVYAMARDRFFTLRIVTEGQTPEQIEADLRAQLEAAFPGDSVVHVSGSGDEMIFQIQPPDGADTPFGVTLDGEEVLEPGTEPAEIVMHPVDIEVPIAHGASDAEIKAATERALKARGQKGEVTVKDGKISISHQE
jgi:hypothetical protein